MLRRYNGVMHGLKRVGIMLQSRRWVSLRALVLLCLITIPSSSIPYLDGFIDNSVTTSGITHESPQYIAVPATLSTNNNIPAFYRRNIAKENTRITFDIRWALPIVAGKFTTPNSYRLPVSPAGWGGIYPRDYQQSCQLLDIPPPPVASC